MRKVERRTILPATPIRTPAEGGPGQPERSSGQAGPPETARRPISLTDGRRSPRPPISSDDADQLINPLAGPLTLGGHLGHDVGMDVDDTWAYRARGHDPLVGVQVLRIGLTDRRACSSGSSMKASRAGSGGCPRQRRPQFDRLATLAATP